MISDSENFAMQNNEKKAAKREKKYFAFSCCCFVRERQRYEYVMFNKI